MGEKIIDYISGQLIEARPEEVNATQPFSKMLVEDYGYEKEDIITRPQFRVKRNPSDKKGYPIDIAVFENKNGKRKLKMIVECKKPSVKIGDTKQLEIYLSLSDAEIGVMFNGKESIYIHKQKQGNNDIFEVIPAIPKKGEKLSEIGLYKKKNLKSTHNLKNIFNEIRGWIVANGNITDDRTIASQMVLLILCKIYDERFTEVDKNLEFRATLLDTDDEIKQRIDNLFLATKAKYDDVIQDNDIIEFNGKTLRGIIGRIQSFSIIDTERDCIADAFEVFIDKSVKESEGQFFTPRNVIHTIIEAVDIKKNDKIIDSACGSGGFLVEALKRLETIVDIEGNKYGWSQEAKNEEIKTLAIKNIRGIEKDPFLTKLSKSYMAILGDGKGGIFQEDSLEVPSNWQPKTQCEIKFNTFDVLLANPPFGKNIKVEGEEKLSQYQLAYTTNESNKRKLVKSGNVSTLFLERNLQLVKPGGKIGIILPEPYFALPKYKDAMEFMFKGNNIMWVIDLPHDTFRPHNNAKCCAIIIQKGVEQQEYINMAVAEYIGHNHQGKPIYNLDGTIKDDTPQIIKEIKERKSNNGNLVNKYARQLSFKVSAKDVYNNKILVPRFYWVGKLENIKQDAIENNISLISMQQLIDEKIITYFNGHGSPKAEFKGEGNIPYIRVKDIVNWQPYIDVTSLIPQEEYDRLFSERKILKPKDILYVSRGSYRIGSVAMVSPYDEEMILTREIVVIRVIKKDNKYGLTPEYLMYALSHKYAWEQTKNKVFYEPCLPNIASRWKEIFIPIPNDPKIYDIIKETAYNSIQNQWSSKEKIQILKNKYNTYLV